MAMSIIVAISGLMALLESFLNVFMCFLERLARENLKMKVVRRVDF
jgi:amino acid permease